MITPIDFNKVIEKLFVRDEKGNTFALPKYPIETERNAYLTEDGVQIAFRIPEGKSAVIKSDCLKYLEYAQFFSSGAVVTFERELLAHLGLEKVMK